MNKDQILGIKKVYPGNELSYYRVPVDVWEEIVKREKRRKMKLELDFTAQAKDLQEWGDVKALTKEQTEKQSLTILTLDFPNGEPWGISQVHPDPSNGRKAAKRLDRYCPCEFLDKTKA